MGTVAITKNTFNAAIEKAGIVVIDWWAPWCGPCRGFAPVFEKVADANPDATFAKINTDEEQELASAFQIRSIPTLMVFRDEVLVFSRAGALPQAMLEDIIAKVRELDMNEVRAEIARDDARPPSEGT